MELGVSSVAMRRRPHLEVRLEGAKTLHLEHNTGGASVNRKQLELQSLEFGLQLEVHEFLVCSVHFCN